MRAIAGLREILVKLLETAKGTRELQRIIIHRPLLCHAPTARPSFLVAVCAQDLPEIAPWYSLTLYLTAEPSQRFLTSSIHDIYMYDRSLFSIHRLHASFIYVAGRCFGYPCSPDLLKDFLIAALTSQ